MITLDKTYDPLAWGSHVAPLMACAGASTGPILELGVGHFSTPLLHAYCMATSRKLMSVEDNLEWCEGFRRKYECENHVFINATYSDIVPKLSSCRFGVVLIDNSPGGKRRSDDFSSLLPVSDFIIVHDYHAENEEAIEPLLVGVLFRIYSEYMPPTLIASAIKPLPKQ